MKMKIPGACRPLPAAWATAAIVLLSACGGGGSSGETAAAPGPLAAPTGCQPIPQNLRSTFEVEGPSPYSADGCAMVFDALAAQYTTSNGHGWRHELKIPSRLRTGMTRTSETLVADFTVDLSKGGKTIITQYHAEGTGTIVKVYVADSAESGFLNSVANDGIFDVYVRILPAGSSSEEKMALGTIVSGNTFQLSVSNQRGNVSVSAFGRTKTAAVADGGASYLKFGNYLQSQDPVSLQNCSPFAGCYAAYGIVEAKVTMRNVSYSRD
ncbi:polysaccharide lyase family 7 protein [Piscinibacter sakaiensis]|uniref:polysaccharide lyase family 7 protein n=1 Tax=Piscinibacter sakaiensis TaxID=1547922 RepID=UPI003AAEBA13